MAMRKIIFLMTATAALAGCAHQDKPASTSFTPVAGNGFVYQAVGDAAYPEQSKVAEASRMQALQGYLDQNHLCPNGYKITSRTPAKVNGNIVQITYEGVCT
jgi:hypothetical protein